MTDEPLAEKCQMLFYRMDSPTWPRGRLFKWVRFRITRHRSRKGTLMVPIVCVNAPVRRMEQTGSPKKKFNGPIDVCATHIKAVEMQNFVNSLFGQGFDPEQEFREPDAAT